MIAFTSFDRNNRDYVVYIYDETQDKSIPPMVLRLSAHPNGLAASDAIERNLKVGEAIDMTPQVETHLKEYGYVDGPWYMYPLTEERL